MDNKKPRLFTILFLFPLLAIGQFPKGHFLDADKKFKPFKQEKENLYHYAVLSELPFENDCQSGLSEEGQSACSKKTLRNLIYDKLEDKSNFKGNVYLYLTVTENAEITDVSIKSSPNSESINSSIEQVINTLDLKPGKYNDRTVNARLWTNFTFPSSSQVAFSESLEKMEKNGIPDRKDFEDLIFDASQYIFSIPVYYNGTEFQSASQIIEYWMDQDMGMSIPAFGDFYKSLTNTKQQQFLYAVAMIYYSLDQKINNDRILDCKPLGGKKYSKQEDVREVQLGGAKILLEFMGNVNNNVPMTLKTKKYYQAFRNGKLEKKLFK